MKRLEPASRVLFILVVGRYDHLQEMHVGMESVLDYARPYTAGLFEPDSANGRDKFMLSQTVSTIYDGGGNNKQCLSF